MRKPTYLLSRPTLQGIASTTRSLKTKRLFLTERPPVFSGNRYRPSCIWLSQAHTGINLNLLHEKHNIITWVEKRLFMEFPFFFVWRVCLWFSILFVPSPSGLCNFTVPRGLHTNRHGLVPEHNNEEGVLCRWGWYEGLLNKLLILPCVFWGLVVGIMICGVFRMTLQRYYLRNALSSVWGIFLNHSAFCIKHGFVFM